MAGERGRVRGLDGMRGIACLCVVAAHTMTHFAPTTSPAGIPQFLAQGLIVFFTLSGFLIYWPFARDVLSGERTVDVADYAVRRVLRVFPGYLVIFVVVNFLLHAVYVTNAVETGAPNSDAGTGMITDPLRLLAQLTLTQSLLPSQLQTGINPAWSLTVELGFYVALPLLAVPLVRRAARNRWWLATLPAVLLFVLGIAGKTWATVLEHQRPDLDPFVAEFGSNWIAVLSTSFLSIADTFAPGMVVLVVFLALRADRLAWLTPRRTQWLGWSLVAVSGAAALALHEVLPRFLATAVAVAAAAILLMVVEPAARGRSSWLMAAADWRPARYVGEISLSAYLWHYPVIILLSRVDVGITDSWVGVVYSFVLTSALGIALASITYRWVEKPGQRLRRFVRVG